MTTMWGTDEVAISTLMRDVNNSKLALPRFQRPSVWTKANWVPFLATVLRGRPTGTLLLLEAGEDGEEFAPKNLETSPALIDGEPLKWLLLDGQQRLTTLYRALHSSFVKRKDGPNHEFVVDVREALKRRELLDQDLELVKGDAVPGFAGLAEQGKVTFKVMLDPATYASWQEAYVNHHLSPQKRGLGDLVKDLAETMAGAASISDYKFPVLKIDRETPLDVVVDIFEGMNRRGQKLNQFDLMVARLYKSLPSGGKYDLRAEWEDALEKATHLRTLGIDGDDGMLPLQLIAKQVSRLPEDKRPEGVKGLNNKDVLELPAPQVIGDDESPIPGLSLRESVGALDAAAEFLRRVCGVRSSVLLAQKSMLLPLADQYLRAEDARLSEADLKKWFLCIGLNSDYYGSVNSYADADCDNLAAWADDPTAVPDHVSNVTKNFVDGLDLLQACSREGRILGVSVLSLLISAGARDWSQGALTLSVMPDPMELHHMVPKRRLNSILEKSRTRDPIAGLTPITTSANAQHGDQEPNTVVNDLGQQASSIMASHKVDQDLLIAGNMGADSYDTFLEDRENQLRKLIKESLGL